jgi:Kef-type K+ transport system membrane component KefB
VEDFLHLILGLGIIITGAKLGGWAAIRLRQPAVLGELLVGLILGPSVLNLLGWPAFGDVHDSEILAHTVYELAEVGVVLLMFMAGLEIDVSEMLKTGRVAVTAGVMGVVVPLILGAGTALLFRYPSQAAIFVGIILTATSVSISTQTLLELGRLRTPEGLALLGAAIVDDVLVILLLSIFLALNVSSEAQSGVFMIVVQMVLFLAGSIVLGFWLLPKAADWVQDQPISEGLAALAVVAALLFSWAAEEFGGLATITGAFIAGLGFGRSHLREEVAGKMHTIAYSFFVPIFFVSIGLKTNIRLLTGDLLPLTLVLIAIAILSKIIGSGLGARAAGFDRQRSLRVGLGMVSRGEVGLIVASVGVSAAIIKTELFSVVTVIVLVTTLVTPLLLRWGFRDEDKPKGSAKEVARA